MFHAIEAMLAWLGRGTSALQNHFKYESLTEVISEYTSSTAQGGDGSFKNRKLNLYERLVVASHGCQSKTTD